MFQTKNKQTNNPSTWNNKSHQNNNQESKEKSTKKINKMTGISAQHSTRTLNINDLNIPNQDTDKQIGSKAGNIFLFPLRKYFTTRGKKRHYLRIKGCSKQTDLEECRCCCCNIWQSTAHYKTKRKDKEGHFMWLRKLTIKKIL